MKKAVPAVLLAVAVTLLYRKVTRLWWTYDDGYNLKVASTHAWSEPFTDPALWPQKTFTPLLSATNELLLNVFAFDVQRWYAVHLAILVAAALAVLAALRLWVPRPAALAGAFLFAAGIPLCAMATQLMTIHLLESILLGALAVVLYVEGVRRHRYWMSALSSLLYLGALLAKELALPLPLLLLILPERELRHRARHAVPHALALAVYLGWRHHLFGTVFGAYGFAVAPAELPRLAATLPWKVIAACAGAAVAAGIILILLLAAGASGALRDRRRVAVALVALALILIPLVPLSKQMQRSYALLPWLWMCALFAVGIERLRWRGAVILAALAVAGVANRQEWTSEYNRAQRMSEEARVFLTMPADAILRGPTVPPPLMTELTWMQQHRGLPSGATYFYDDVFLCNSAAFAGRRVFEYDTDRRRVMEITARVPDLAQRYCSTIRDDAPLRAEFEYRDRALFWSFGPYDGGRWSVVLANGLQAFEVPRKDGFRLGDLPGIALRVRYQAPEGWVTYSPEIALDFARQTSLAWQR